MEEKPKYKSIILWIILYSITIFFFTVVGRLLYRQCVCGEWEEFPASRVAGCGDYCNGAVSLP